MQGDCIAPTDAFYDVATAIFRGNVQADGSLLVTDLIELSFAGGNQSVTMTVVNQVLTGDGFTPPVVPGVLPIGN